MGHIQSRMPSYLNHKSGYGCSFILDFLFTIVIKHGHMWMCNSRSPHTHSCERYDNIHTYIGSPYSHERYDNTPIHTYIGCNENRVLVKRQMGLPTHCDLILVD